MLRLRKKQPHADSIEAYACDCICMAVACPCECPCDPGTLVMFTSSSQRDTMYAEGVLNDTKAAHIYG